MNSEPRSFVYITSNWAGNVLYTGVTTNLKKRIFEHKTKAFGGFSCKYNVDKLVYYEVFADVRKAIEREKIIKGDLGERRFNSFPA